MCLLLHAETALSFSQPPGSETAAVALDRHER
jgi:hypothetical protein